MPAQMMFSMMYDGTVLYGGQANRGGRFNVILYSSLHETLVVVPTF